MKRVIAVGHAALDHVYRIEAFPPTPRKVRALEHIDSGGGMAANAAAAAAHLGAPAELWSRVGDDAAGHLVRQLLQSDGAIVDWVRVIPGGRTSTSAVIVDAQGERLIVGERDHAMSMDASWVPLERIAGAGAVLSDQRWLEATMVAFLEARAARVPTILDADLGGVGTLPDFLRLTDYAIFSEPGLQAFAPDARDQRARLEQVLAAGPRHAGVTRGPYGYVWIDADEGRLRHQPSFSVPVVDTTGAGDAFHGAFACGLASGLDTAECVRLAAATAALKCRKLGARAGLPGFAEVRQFLKSDS